MKQRPSSTTEVSRIVERYEQDSGPARRFLGQIVGYITESPELRPLVHSVRSRLKDPEHLRAKLKRKGLLASVGGTQVEVTPDTLFQTMTDLAGCRILHLYQSQFFEIHRHLVNLFSQESLALVEGPIARTWDDETRRIFNERGIAITNEESMYTSVHYVIGSASQAKVTCELQVRTLVEETWGELSHSVNYPTPSPDPLCAAELRLLARIGSSAVRMVECIQARNEVARRPLARRRRRRGDPS